MRSCLTTTTAAHLILALTAVLASKTKDPLSSSPDQTQPLPPQAPVPAHQFDPSPCSFERPPGPDALARCPSNAACDSLDVECLRCRCPADCAFGKEATAVCTARPEVSCVGNATVERTFRCQYCFQASKEDFACDENFECESVAPPWGGQQGLYKANCTVKEEVLCLGKRQFLRQVKCNWTAGYKWTTALALSITLGGFGADRFYLGHWQEGIGKLFSFGGLGVWTLVDVVLVAIRYIGPADGSLYI